MRFDILSLFPRCFKGPFDESMIKRAREKGLIDIEHVNVRDFTHDLHQKVDDRPYGGGPGMVMMAQPVVDAIRSVKREHSRVIYMTPQGAPLTAAKCRELAQINHLVILCGHYEGIDERVVELEVDEEISIGDYVLTSGVLPAMVLVDAVSRFVPGVIGHEEAVANDSFEKGIFDCPHYTRPRVFENVEVPEVLLNGNHAEIEAWRQKCAREKTIRVRERVTT